MAPFSAVQVSALLTIFSFSYISHSLARHSLADRPRLSSLLLLLFSSALCYISSLFSKWLPGSDGRFAVDKQDGAAGPLLGSGSEDADQASAVTQLPARPRRWFLPAVILGIVFRLELFHRVNYLQQCATPGVECFLCLLLLGYELCTSRRKLGTPSVADLDDPWRSTLNELQDWLKGPSGTVFLIALSASVFCHGAYVSAGQFMRSSYFCFSLVDSRLQVFGLQCAGLVLDACIAVLFWRALVWTRTTKARLRMLASVLFLASASMMLLWAAISIARGSRQLHVSFGSLYAFDVIVDSFAFATLMISMTFWVCETTPVTTSAVTTFSFGIFGFTNTLLHVGDWVHNSRAGTLLSLALTIGGAVSFAGFYDMRYVIFFKRTTFTTFMGVFFVLVTLCSLFHPPQYFGGRHPINDLIYKAHTEFELWQNRVKSSDSLAAAVRNYPENNRGREPPPHFDAWYALARESVIVDVFPQIEKDLEPFWRLSPDTIRTRVDKMLTYADVATITIKAGEVSASQVRSKEQGDDLEELAKLIRRFSEHLPDMVLPINLSPAPRILPPWAKRHSQSHADLSALADLLSKRSDGTDQTSDHASEAVTTKVDSSSEGHATWASEFRQMQIEACPPESRSKMNPQWTIREFCWDCCKAHSEGQFLVNFDRSLDVCSQPDLKYLHGFSLTDPQLPPVRELLPLFGPSKTSEFSDIIIPIPRTQLEKPDLDWPFERRYDNLFWKGSLEEHAITNQALHGNHKLRLLHMANNPNPDDKVTMLLSRPGDTGFWFESVPLSQATNIFKFSVGINDYSACTGDNCDIVKQAYGTRAGTTDPLEHRYVIVTDEDNGPPKETIRTLRSGSVPFLSTIFRTWYTDRLMPWMHFVPLDPRYQALHSTYAYFTGTEDRTNLNGGKTSLKGRTQDAEWIAGEGKTWVERAMRETDMEVYLFRVLLEWGRLIDDRRNDIGFRKDSKGAFTSDAWTSPKDKSV